MRRRHVLVIAGILVAGAACAASAPNEAPRPSRDVIEPAEFEALNLATAADVVRQLRPRWLQLRSVGGTTEEPVVYVDNMRRGGLAALSQVPATAVREIRYFNATDATTRFGTGHRGGAIVVTTRR
jgi:hypothetical protein